MSLIEPTKFKKVLGTGYLLTLTYLLFLAPFRLSEGTTSREYINFIPGNSYSEFAENFRPSSIIHWILNVPGNVIAFIPIPIIFYWLFKSKASWLEATAMALLIPALIECTQFYFQVGFANIDDVLLNAVGFLIGTWILNRSIKKKAGTVKS